MGGRTWFHWRQEQCCFSVIQREMAVEAMSSWVCCCVILQPELGTVNAELYLQEKQLVGSLCDIFLALIGFCHQLCQLMYEMNHLLTFSYNINSVISYKHTIPSLKSIHTWLYFNNKLINKGFPQCKVYIRGFIVVINLQTILQTIPQATVLLAISQKKDQIILSLGLILERS